MAVNILKDMDEYHHGDGMKLQKSIGDIYWDYGSMREEVGDQLAELGYAGGELKCE